MIYTSVAELERRLDGRLRISGTVQSLGETQIESALVEQIGEQVESQIDAVLRRRYTLPLTNSHPLLASIVEKGVACQLLAQYFVGQTPADNAPSDIGVCAQFYKELKLLDDMALEGEAIASPAQNQRGFNWFYGGSGIRNSPPETVEW